MPSTINSEELQAQIDDLGARIKAVKERSTAVSGVPFAQSTWEDLVEEHHRLKEKMAAERHRHSALAGAHADFEALALSFESFLRGIDQHYAQQIKQRH
ncbi:MAG: hypothetical protein JSS20_20620 [Proteobacteria bacterium]|nr:hypothetical protein [Pseudomonadota bacterium]